MVTKTPTLFLLVHFPLGLPVTAGTDRGTSSVVNETREGIANTSAGTTIPGRSGGGLVLPLGGYTVEAFAGTVIVP